MIYVLLNTIFILTTSILYADSTKININRVTQNLHNKAQSALPDNIATDISVRVTPLHRSKSATISSLEKLDYVEINGFTADEWVTPNTPIEALLKRISKIEIDVDINNASTDTTTLKSLLQKNLGLISGRDSVKIHSPKVIVFNKTLKSFLSLIAFCLMGIFIVYIFSQRSLRIDIAKLKKQSSQSFKQQPSRKKLKSIEDEIHKRDRLVENLNHPDWSVSIEQLSLIESMSKSNPLIVGSALAHLTHSTRKKIYQNLRSEEHFKIFDICPFFSIDTINFLEDLVKLNHKNTSNLNELLTACWRLKYQLNPLLKYIDRNEALYILSKMPYNYSEKYLKGDFHSEWQKFLDGKLKILKPSNNRVEEITKNAETIFPKNSFIESENNFLGADLICFLDLADSGIEQNFYANAAIGSALINIRPPFYPVLKQNKANLQRLLGRTGINHFSAAISLENKEIQKNILNNFTPKQQRLIKMTMQMNGSQPYRQDNLRLSKQLVAAELQNIIAS